ncbi:MAG: DnaJ domain-containing protein [Verrucomicrobia bacterium]|nr:DnaJ domain-containing protein [Verrucomicrobiota bacterium]
MTDNFALLNEPRLPWLDPDELKQKFFQLSSESHPDRTHNASPSEKETVNKRYAELNAAYNCLRDPKERLIHLLELETGGKPKDIQRIPPGTMDLFVEIGQTCRDADTFIAERAKVTSPLMKVQLFEKGMEWTDNLNALQQKINKKRDELIDELKQLNSVWESAPATGSPDRASKLPFERLEQIYRIFSYVNRWTEQIQERVVQLSF